MLTLKSSILYHEQATACSVNDLKLLNLDNALFDCPVLELPILSFSNRRFSRQPQEDDYLNHTLAIKRKSNESRHIIANCE